MECLGVPIDHRLRRVIREARRIDRDKENSDHIQLLHSFGSSLEVDESDYPICDLSFGLEMARPELKGGVLIVLERPHSKQKNSDGFMEGKRNCRTINAVSDLISAVNNDKLGFDDVSLFDAIPFLDETVAGKDHQDIINEAQNVFADMARAKDPDIILCCFKTETQNSLVKKLQSRGVGRSFYPDNPKLTGFGFSSTLVNAFHPSYAVNYYPISSCFKQLLVLEFTKAFALWRQSWTEEPWMKGLRDECRSEQKGKSVVRKSNVIYSNTFSLHYTEKNIDGKWNRSYIKEQWEELLTSLDAQFEKCFFRNPKDIGAGDLQRKLVDSKITWLSCDIAWILEELTPEETITLEMPQQLLCKLRRWCRKAWPEDQLRRNPSNSNGYYDHLPLLLLKSNQPSTLAKSLESRLFGLLRDLNLSFNRLHNDVYHNLLAQGCVFRRFAAAFEDILEDIADNDLSLEGTELHHEMGFLSLNGTAD